MTSHIIIPHFDHYAVYIWGAYGVAIMAMLMMVIATMCLYKRARSEADDVH